MGNITINISHDISWEGYRHMQSINLRPEIESGTVSLIQVEWTELEPNV